MRYLLYWRYVDVDIEEQLLFLWLCELGWLPALQRQLVKQFSLSSLLILILLQ